jgi:phosphoglycolate phosphatase
MLVLFDIDGTILLSGGAGVRAFLRSCDEIFAMETADDRKRFSGGMDPLIFRDLCAMHGVADWERHHDAFRARYGVALERNLSEPGVVKALPGARELVRAVDEHPNVTLGLLTGNYPETGAFKLRTVGLDPSRFEVTAWGVDGNHRRDLPRVAMDRYRAKYGAPIDPRDVVVIGDTPHDVDCAKHNGCRVIGVATGLFSVDELRECGADLAVGSLAETEELLRWIGFR